MEPLSKAEALDRHALVMSIWLALGFIAIALFSYGFGAGGTPFIAAAFAVILIGFIGHVIVNAVYATTFTPGELALGLVLYAAALVAFGLATLLAPGFGARGFVPTSLGLVAVSAAVIVYMVIHFGVRRSFNAFDVVRQFRPGGKPVERLRGGEAP